MAVLFELSKAMHDHFRNTTPESEWETQLVHGEKIGLGTRSYEIVQIK